MRLNEHDPWPTRLTVVFLGVLAILALVIVYLLKDNGTTVEGVLAIPASVVTAFVMQLSRRPPWTRRTSRDEPEQLQPPD